MLHAVCPSDSVHIVPTLPSDRRHAAAHNTCFSVKITDRSFRYESRRLWNQLGALFHVSLVSIRLIHLVHSAEGATFDGHSSTAPYKHSYLLTYLLADTL